MPNADLGSMLIYNQILKFVNKNSNSVLFKSLGTQLYFSLLKYSGLMIGNSSSGIIEAPSLNVYNLNIGDRQKGRVRTSYNIDCKPKRNLIIKNILSIIMKKNSITKFKKNPYYKKGTDKLIVKILKKIDYEKIFIKKFYDISI
jgi:UDP-N-acetylglucosamine 2-epimerase